MTVILASVVGSDAYHELARESDGTKTLRTYLRDRDLDRPATDKEAAEFYETVRRCGGYVKRGGNHA